MAQPNHAPRLVETERGSHRPLLPHRRCLLASQTPCSALRIHKAPLGLGSHHARALFQQLRGVEIERSFLRDAERFFSQLCGRCRPR